MMMVMMMMKKKMLIIAVISIAPYFTDEGVHTALYKIYKNVCIKPQKIK